MCVYMCVCVCVYVYIYTHTYMNTYIYTHTHTHIHTYSYKFKFKIISLINYTTPINTKIISRRMRRSIQAVSNTWAASSLCTVLSQLLFKLWNVVGFIFEGVYFYLRILRYGRECSRRAAVPR